MKTTVQALKSIYANLGGDLADVALIERVPDMLDAINGVISGGGGGSENIIVDFSIAPTSQYNTPVTGTKLSDISVSDAILAMSKGVRIFARLCSGSNPNENAYAFFPLRFSGSFYAFAMYSVQQTISGVNAYYLHADYFQWMASGGDDLVQMTLQDSNHILKFGV